MIDKMQLVLELFGVGDLENARKIVEGYIKELPTIEAESRPKGKWEKHKTKSGKNWWKCPLCGHVEMKRYSYCSICGAELTRGDE